MVAGTARVAHRIATTSPPSHAPPAVATREGAPRTMFKPDDGPDYWQKQKDIEARAARTARRTTASNDDA